MVAQDSRSRELQAEAAVRLTRSQDPRDRDKGQLSLEKLELERDVSELKIATTIRGLPEIARAVLHAEIQRMRHELDEVHAKLSLLRGPSRLDAIHLAMKEILTQEQRDAVSARVRELRGPDRDEEPVEDKTLVAPSEGEKQAAVLSAAYAEYRARGLPSRT